MLKVVQGSDNEVEVIIFSRKSALSDTLIEEFRKKFCGAFTIDLKVENSEWDRLYNKVKDQGQNKKFYILVIIENILDTSSDAFGKNIQRILSLADLNGSKVMFVLPKNMSKETFHFLDILENNLFLKKSVFFGIVFIGELVSPVFSDQEFGLVDGILKKSVYAKSITLPGKNANFYPLSASEATKLLITSLFSMSSYAKKTEILGEPISSLQLANIFSEHRNDLKINFSETIFFNPKNIQEKHFAKIDLNELMTLLKTDFQKNISSEKHKEQNSHLSYSATRTPLSLWEEDNQYPENINRKTNESDTLSDAPINLTGSLFLYFNKLRNRILDKSGIFLLHFRSSIFKTLYPVSKKMSLNGFNFFAGLNKKISTLIKHSKKQSAKVATYELNLQNTDETDVAPSYLQTNFVSNKKTRAPRMRKLLFAFSGSFLILMTPFIFYLISSLLIALSGKTLKSGNLDWAERFLRLSGYTVTISRNTSSVINNVPYGRNFFKNINLRSDALATIIDINSDLLKVIGKELLLVDNADNLQKTRIDIVKDLSLEVKSLYEKLSFWETDSDNKLDKANFNLNPVFSNLTISKLRSKLLITRKLLDQSDVVLGESKPVNYLILLQNSNVIKPTGGTIDSFAVITLSAGEITNLQFFDKEDLDMRPKAELQTPVLLEKYFNKKYLKFEDTNMYTDFTLSAQKAEWYLDKTLNLSVDGVIAIDEDALSELTFNDAENKKLTKAKEIENKDGIKSFFEAFSKGGSKEKLISLMKLGKILDRKQIILFLNDSQAQKAIDDLGWNGSIKTAECPSDCYKDIVGLTEISEQFGSNNLEREVDLDISFQENLIKRKLEFFIENKNDFIYKTYIKLIANPDSGLSPVKVSSNKENLVFNPEIQTASGFKEAGIYVELQPKETKVISFTWESGLENSQRSYTLLVRKQPGVKEYIAKIKLNKKNLDSLTDEGGWDYNTLLSTDFETSLSFESK